MLAPFRMPYLIRSLTKSATAISLVNVALVVAWLWPTATPVIAACFVAATANAQPVCFTGTGHYYERVDIKLDWYQAKADAEARSYLGVSGYLATIASHAGNNFMT